MRRFCIFASATLRAFATEFLYAALRSATSENAFTQTSPERAISCSGASFDISIPLDASD